MEKGIKTLLESAFEAFGPQDAAKALIYLHKVKAYEPKDPLDPKNYPVDEEDWKYIVREFPSVCSNFRKNAILMRDFSKRKQLWTYFKEALQGRLSGAGIRNEVDVMHPWDISSQNSASAD